MINKKSPTILFALGILFVASSFSLTEAPTMKKPVDEIAAFEKAADTYFNDVLQELGSVPGVAIAIVKDDQPIYLKGLGYGDLKNKQKVKKNTNFYIASCTKSYTALLAMHLDKKGIIKLDDPITKYLPEVKFDAQLEADKVSIRDLLQHTSGLQNSPITYRLAYSGEHTLDKLIDLLQYTEANKAGRGHYQYTNFGYNLYTIISDKITGKTWQQWLEEIIFEPTKMNQTTAYMSRVQKKNWTLAKPHMNLIGQTDNEVYLVKTDQSMQSAGGLITTAEDAARWLELQMNEGKLDGKQLFPADMIRYTHQKHADTGGGEYGEFGRDYYGMGWRVGEFHGHPNINHFGGYPGYLSHISFDPEAKLGVAIFTNEAYWGDNVMNLFAAFVYDYWYGNPDEVVTMYQDKKNEMLEHAKKVSKRIQKGIEDRAKRTWNLEGPWTKYTGTYSNDILGTIEIKGYEDRIEVKNGHLQCVATPFTKENSMRVELVPGSGEVIEFEYEGEKVIGLRTNDLKFKKK